MHKEVLRLASLLAGVALATSRLGLIGHELVGHGGMALVLGGTIDQVQLFWFAGGWIRYHLAEPNEAAALAIAMAGIALEFVTGSLLWFVARGDTLGRRITRGIGCALALHAGWYLATGAFHGFGDGLILYRMLGSWRTPVALGAALLTVGAGYLGAREVLGALAGTLRGSRRARLAGTIIAVVLAAGTHAALTAGELAARSDPTYAQTMQPERERVVAKELAEWQAAQAQQGVEITQEQKRVEEKRLTRVHRPFPFVPLLAIATGLAIALGAWRAKPATESRISNRLLAITTTIAIASVWAVIVIDGLVV
ncbi:MAG TPA: hypothetical protein VL326_12055 [Kofleriaceae bacterium]|nr:hypothetical protein [Kofleriaceae bacterium]